MADLLSVRDLRVHLSVDAGTVKAVDGVSFRVPERGTVGPRCRDHALKHGLILRATWDAMLLSPPLIISREQVDELFDKTWKALEDTAADLGM